MKDWLKKLKIPPTYTFFVKIFILLMLYFAVFRLAFILIYKSSMDSASTSDILKSFIYGARFDASISSYFILPFFLFGVLPFIGLEFSKIMRKIVHIGMLIMFVLFTVLMVINFDFFAQFNTHLDYAVVEYLNSPGEIVDMVWGKYPIIQYTLLIIVIIVGFYFAVKLLMKKVVKAESNLVYRIFLFLLMGGLLFLGIRGRTGTGVMRWGAAYFSENNMVNQAAQNPVFHLLKDLYFYNKAKKNQISKKLSYYKTNEEAIANIQKLIFNPSDSLLDKDYPFYKKTTYKNKEKQHNVMIILMETFTAELTGVIGKKYNLTPEFDKLANNGVLFDNFYSNGQRSNNAFSAIMCSYPVIAGKSIILQMEGQQKMPSMASILKQRGYNTYYFHGGDLEFDNMKGFLRSKGVDNFVGQEDFDPKVYVNKWGAPDEFLYKRALDELDKNGDKPFFSLLFTISNHEPFDIPEADFERVKIDSEWEDNYNTFKYADWSLGKFFEEVSKKDYFDNTIFVIVGDHSKSYYHDIEFDYRVSHVPCLFYAPQIINKTDTVDSRLASHIDIAPTLFSLMNISSENAFFGKNILKPVEEKPYALIFKNKMFGFLQDDFYYMGGLGQKGKLLKYKDFSGKDLSKDYPNILKNMEKKFYSISQGAYHIYKSRKIAF